MPFTVITLTNAPPQLRGDLTKWMQEISTGVYVGNINSKIREQLWKRVKELIKTGQATISFASRNEIGYLFETHNTSRISVDFEGIPLVYIPKESSIQESKYGFSKASQNLKYKRYSLKNQTSELYIKKDYVVLDIETDGLDSQRNNIIEFGAIKFEHGVYTKFERLVKTSISLPQEIIELTGITNQLLEQKGSDLVDILNEFTLFINDLPIIGYNVKFDISFINENLRRNKMKTINNSFYDLIVYIKREKMFLKNYSFESVLYAYGLNEKVKHRALSDATLVNDLLPKVNEFLKDFLKSGTI